MTTRPTSYPCIYFHAKGKPQVDVQYVMGKPFGTITWTDGHGHLLLHIMFEDPQLKDIGDLATAIEFLIMDHNDPFKNERGRLADGDKDAVGSNREDLSDVEAA